MDKKLRDISDKMISRYSERYKKLGYDVKTLGWGSKEQQLARFEQTLNNGIDFSGKNILDIGCGFGDLARFFQAENIRFRSYRGWDLNPDLIREASNIWKQDPSVQFEVRNVASLDAPAPVADIGIMLGVLNLNLKGDIDNYEYARQLVSQAFQVVEECLIVDFLSARLTPEYPREDFVFYYEPSLILDMALSLSNNVVINHSYAPIPQKEFMVLIYK